jgi:hypothetical protein
MALARLTTVAATAPALQATPSAAETLPPVPIRPHPSDPVFAAMERWQRLEQISIAMEGADFEAAAILDVRRARLMLAETRPTSVAGLNALTAFLGDWGREVGEDRMFFFDPGDEVTAYAKSIARTVALLEAQDLADPVFLASERHRMAWDRYGSLCRYADDLDELYVERIGEERVREAFKAVSVAELALIETSEGRSAASLHSSVRELVRLAVIIVHGYALTV